MLRNAILLFAIIVALANPAEARRRKHHHHAVAANQTASIDPQADAASGAGDARVGELVNINLNGQTFNYWETGKLGQTPLIIFSHGFGSCRTPIAFMATELAKQG